MARRSITTVSAEFDDLFGQSPAWPSGLRYLAEFLSAAAESRLLDQMSRVPIHEAQYYGYSAKRRVASFGFSYDFALRKLDAAAPLPDFLFELRQAVADRLSLPPDAFEQALINEYRPGTPLGWHRDTPEFESVAGVSLGGSCRIRFRPFPPKRGRDPKTFTLNAEPRSLYLMQDDARWKWQHSVAPTRVQRWSITFRTMRAKVVDDAAPV